MYHVLIIAFILPFVRFCVCVCRIFNKSMIEVNFLMFCLSHENSAYSKSQQTTVEKGHKHLFFAF